MAIAMCKRCDTNGRMRMISISNIPGGNPAAKENPEMFATTYFKCKSCGEYLCDKCHKEISGKFSFLMTIKGPACVYPLQTPSC